MADLAFNVAGNILEKLGSIAYDEISLEWGMKDDLRKLKETTSTLKAVLLDAEKKQEENEQLRIWLTRLTDVFEDAQDVLDEFECEALRSEVVKEYGSLVRKVRRFFSHSNPFAFRFRIAHQVKEIRQKLDDIAKEIAKFQLISSQLNQEKSNLMQRTREMTHSFVKASEVIGRNREKEQIKDIILHHHPDNSNNISVIPIVGFGGLGKTTLAKLVYNDEEVKKKFGNFRMWVCVSLDFDVTGLTREILLSALTATKTDEDISNHSLDLLQKSLGEIIKDKKFLLVLDDIWNEDPIKWKELTDVLTLGSEESKIIVTTRNMSIASIVGTTQPYKLECLSHEDSLSLFFKCAFGDEKRAKEYPKLMDIGKEIVKKCRGVPLALKALGSLLHLKTEAEWRFIRDNKIWELEQYKHGNILPIIRLSYNLMSPCLKQCFAYCSTFPAYEMMNSFELIRIWTALGILQSPNNKVELEDIGGLHLIELFARSFFQSVKLYGEDNYGINYYFRVHDLIHDLACSITQGVCSIVSSDGGEVSDRVRYLRICLNENNLAILQKLRKVRSIHVYCNEYEEDELVQLFISSCISRSKHLRVFDLSKLSFEVLPSSIGTMKHLRYLNLNDNKWIKKLPDSICKLQSLQTLLVVRCEELEELPRDIQNLVSLSTLAVTTKQTFFAEGGIGRLKSIRVLGIGDSKNLRALPHDLGYCTTLRTLIITDCGRLNLASGPIDEVVELTLQTFVIKGLPETTDLPQWLQHAAKTLQNLHISRCPKLATLPEWLPKLTSLEKLVIKKCPGLSSLPEGMQHLRSLTYLKIKYCWALQERCKCGVGEDWPKIARILNVVIGYQSYHYSAKES